MEEDTKQVRQAIRLSIQDSKDELKRDLQHIHDWQQRVLDELYWARKSVVIQAYRSDWQRHQMQDTDSTRLLVEIDSNISARREKEIERLRIGHEFDADKLVLRTQRCLHNNDDTSQGHAAFLSNLRHQQQRELEELEARYREMRQILHESIVTTFRRRCGAENAPRSDGYERLRENLQLMLTDLACDLKWFEVIEQRRLKLIDEHIRLSLQSFDFGLPVDSLTLNDARRVIGEMNQLVDDGTAPAESL